MELLRWANCGTEVRTATPSNAHLKKLPPQAVRHLTRTALHTALRPGRRRLLGTPGAGGD
ncbi:hypothetical protein [Kitasatospora sp. NPDC057223]|uniref:hypothetical protein n=1 Tax=Kitasatospora sp. NPDC057223 TaxID=3346055 RepID=UPI003630C6A4